MNFVTSEQLSILLDGRQNLLWAFSDHPYLIIRNSSLPKLSTNEILPELDCTVIGIGELPSNVNEICDVVVDDEKKLEPIIRNIEKYPLAATTLVQTLRAIENRSWQNGLTIESLAYATLQTGPEYLAWLDNFTPRNFEVTDEGPAVIVDRINDTLHITLNRASCRNAISVEVRDSLCEAFDLALLDDDIKRLTLRGNGACFSIGGDLDEFGHTPDPLTGHLIRSVRLPGRKLAQCAERIPVTAYVHSACIGAGIELPAFADKIIAQADSFFQLPEITFGLIPGAGGCVSLTKRVGKHHAAELCLSGKKIKAKRALEIGLIDEIQLN